MKVFLKNSKIIQKFQLYKESTLLFGVAELVSEVYLSI